MSTEQFNYILAQIEHLIYKQNTKWWQSIPADEKRAMCISYLYSLNYFCYHLKAYKYVYHSAPIIAHSETVLCREGYF